MNEYAIPFTNATKNMSIDRQQSRNGDWICTKCNNLNFSFRKKCNRCRQQSKQQNDTHLMSAYQTYYQYYQQEAHQNLNQPLGCAIPVQNTNRIQEKILLSPNPRLQKIRILEKQLPSVSPLLKRYNSSRTGRKINPLSQKQLYSNNSWQNECLSSYSSDQDQGCSQYRQQRNQDLQRILQNIFI